jgi:hypothetical protein
LSAGRGQTVTVTIRFRDPQATNTHGDNPRVSRVDVIVGDITGTLADPKIDRNPTTRVLARFTEQQWTRQGDWATVTTRIPKLERSMYVRVRGTNTGDLEPPMDTRGENPWSDLWFYSNPIFVEIR